MVGRLQAAVPFAGCSLLHGVFSGVCAAHPAFLPRRDMKSPERGSEQPQELLPASWGFALGHSMSTDFFLSFGGKYRIGGHNQLAVTPESSEKWCYVASFFPCV